MGLTLQSWVAIETLAVLVENLAIVYFLNRRFQSKRGAVWPQPAFWLVLVSWGLIATFGIISQILYDIVCFGIKLGYLIWIKHGTFFQKIFAVVLVTAITIAISLIGAGVAAIVTDTSIVHTLAYQDTARVLAITFIKALQVIVFFVLATRRLTIQHLRKPPVLVLGIAAIINCAVLLSLRVLVEVPNLTTEQGNLMIWISGGLLLILVSIFAMYEVFTREEARYIELMTRFQRVELETGFYKEIDAIYSDMQKWRHDYKNNLIALRALVEHGETEKAISFIDGIADEPTRNRVTLQTGNLVLDAVVSSKLWIAVQKQIDVSIQAVCPEHCRIKDNDLCAIAGNLLDNAIEACERLTESGENRFIAFSLLLKGKNLTLSICNSFDGEIKRDGEQYLSLKSGPFHGKGLAYVQSIVNKYEGYILRQHSLGVFETYVILPLLEPTE